MFVSRKVHNAVKADRDHWIAEEARTRGLLAQARESARTLDLVAAKYKDERDNWRSRALAAEGEIAKRKQHAMSNLRQFKKSQPIEVRELQ